MNKIFRYFGPTHHYIRFEKNWFPPTALVLIIIFFGIAPIRGERELEMYIFYGKKYSGKNRPVFPHIHKDFDLLPPIFLQDFITHFGGSMQFLGQKNVRHSAPKKTKIFLTNLTQTT